MTAAENLHQQGLLAASAGRFEDAVRLLAAAVEGAPDVRQFRTNLGLGLARSGRLEEAITAYRGALALSPGHAGTLGKLGRVLVESGRAAEGVTTLEQAVRAEPDNPDTANALGAALAAAGERDSEARHALRRAVALDRDFGEAWRNLGLLEARAEAWGAAAEALGHAVRLEPPVATLLYQYGVALARSGQRPEALAAYRRAVELDPQFVEAWNNLAHELAALGERGEALTAVEHALALRPNYLEARYNLGVTLQSLERIEEARQAYQLVLAGAVAGSALADTLNNLGGLCLAEADPRRAIPLYRASLAAHAAHPEAGWNLGLAHLSVGEWEEGWRHYEARPLKRPLPPIRRWRHGDDLAGASVFVWCEQGLGDAVQFLRFTGELRRLGAGRIVVECPRALRTLFEAAEGIHEVVVQGDAARPCDYQVPLMSLPFELAMRPDSLPLPGPAYRLDEPRARWREKLAALPGGPLKVGLVWGGNPVNRAGLHRSMPLAEASRLARLAPDCTLVSLQHGEQLADLAAHSAIIAWPQADLLDTAALAAELDLVITVDTLMAHLAGTVARRAWVLLPLAADWRWMTGRTDSPWYPSMRLFRQAKRGDWAGVVDAVASALAALDETA